MPPEILFHVTLWHAFRLPVQTFPKMECLTLERVYEFMHHELHLFIGTTVGIEVKNINERLY